jgi:arginine repressor
VCAVGHPVLRAGVRPLVTMGAAEETMAPLMGVPSTVFVRVTDGQAPKADNIVDAGANRIDIAGRIFDADAVFDVKVQNVPCLY